MNFKGQTRSISFKWYTYSTRIFESNTSPVLGSIAWMNISTLKAKRRNGYWVEMECDNSIMYLKYSTIDIKDKYIIANINNDGLIRV